jgi:hypothetical protein
VSSFSELESVPSPAEAARSPTRARGVLAVGVLALGLFEIGAHVRNVTRTHDFDPSYREAATYLAAHRNEDDKRAPDAVRAGPRDLILFAPAWSDPLGRTAFGASYPEENVGHLDTSRYHTLWELAQDGAARTETRGLTLQDSQTFGRLRLRKYKNPAYEHVKDDLLALTTPESLDVFVREPARPPVACRFAVGMPSGGPWEPATPAKRWECPGVNVGRIHTVDFDYQARRCISANPPPGRSLRFVFHRVRFARTFVMHHGLHFRAAQHRAAPVRAIVSVRELLADGQVTEHELGRASEEGGAGFSEVRMDTRGIEGEEGDLLLDIESDTSANRMYCWEGTTR